LLGTDGLSWYEVWMVDPISLLELGHVGELSKHALTSFRSLPQQVTVAKRGALEATPMRAEAPEPQRRTPEPASSEDPNRCILLEAFKILGGRFLVTVLPFVPTEPTLRTNLMEDSADLGAMASAVAITALQPLSECTLLFDMSLGSAASAADQERAHAEPGLVRSVPAQRLADKPPVLGPCGQHGWWRRMLRAFLRSTSSSSGPRGTRIHSGLGSGRSGLFRPTQPRLG